MNALDECTWESNSGLARAPFPGEGLVTLKPKTNLLGFLSLQQQEN